MLSAELLYQQLQHRLLLHEVRRERLQAALSPSEKGGQGKDVQHAISGATPAAPSTNMLQVKPLR